MSKIQVLDPHISNMIAAGEVVERPANIVKECVENSIDAHAKEITIEAYEGGIDKLVIQDDGEGMSREDAKLAFLRHATSKLKDEDDLFNIQTMGFRGEALPSIAAVSKVVLSTSDGDEGSRIEYDYGELKGQESISIPQGTKIEVSGLFYKTPARFKYLRKASYEFSVIADLVNKMALSHPNIRFRLFHNDRLVFQSSGKGNILEILYQMYGKEVAENAVPLNAQNETFKLSGYAIQPKINRSTKYFIFLSINDRLVRSIPLQNAIIETYHNYMPPNRFPIVLLNIDVDTQLVDVNVHPNKWEVRIAQQNDLIQLIKETINDAFTKELRTVEISPQKEKEKEKKVVQPSLMEEMREEVQEIDPIENVYEQSMIPKKQPTIFEELKEEVREVDPIENVYEQEEPFQPIISEQSYEYPIPIPKKKEKGHAFFDHLRIIGQLRSSYILCENEEGLVVIDQHAAQERYHYEQLQKELMQLDPKKQPLMLPLQVHASPSLIAHVDTINEQTEPFGIHFEVFGSDRLIVREIPLWMQCEQEEEFLERLLDFFMEHLRVDIAQLRKHIVATMACHSSIRFHRDLSKQEMEQVIKDLQKCEQPYHCPHGRPTVITLSDSMLRKEFERG